MPPSAGACQTTDAALKPDCGRALIWSSIITAIGWRLAISGATRRPVNGAWTRTGVGTGVGVGRGVGVGVAVGAAVGVRVGVAAVVGTSVGATVRAGLPGLGDAAA